MLRACADCGLQIPSSLVVLRDRRATFGHVHRAAVLLRAQLKARPELERGVQERRRRHATELRRLRRVACVGGVEATDDGRKSRGTRSESARRLAFGVGARDLARERAAHRRLQSVAAALRLPLRRGGRGSNRRVAVVARDQDSGGRRGDERRRCIRRRGRASGSGKSRHARRSGGVTVFGGLRSTGYDQSK